MTSSKNNKNNNNNKTSAMLTVSRAMPCCSVMEGLVV